MVRASEFTNDDQLHYILISKNRINAFMRKKEYRKAFGMLILVIERLDETERVQFINYYSRNMQHLGVFDNGLQAD